MDSLTLELKSEITDRNGIKILDLTERTYVNKNNASLISILPIPDDIEMRSDIITYKFYGDDSNFDTLLKFNEISNPYSVEQGLLFQIPEKTELKEYFSNSNKLYQNNDEIEKTDSKITNSTADLSQDDIRYQYINSSKTNGEIPEYANGLPPNMSRKDITEVKVLRDGSMELGIFT